MGTVNIVFATYGAQSGAAPVYNGSTLAAENVTSSATSAQSAAAPLNCVARIATDTAIYAIAGKNPTASAGGTWLVPADGSLDLFVLAGDKIAVIDA